MSKPTEYVELVLQLPDFSAHVSVVDTFLLKRGHIRGQDFWCLKRRGTVNVWESAVLLSISAHKRSEVVPVDIEDELNDQDSKPLYRLQVRFLIASQPRSSFEPFVIEVFDLANHFGAQVLLDEREANSTCILGELERIADNIERDWGCAIGSSELRQIIESYYGR